MDRPLTLEGVTFTKVTGSGTVYITINSHEGKPVEIFVSLGKSGSEERALAEGIGRLCSVALRWGVPLATLRKQLRGISSELTIGLGPNKVLSVPDAIGISMEEFYNDNLSEETPRL